MTDREIIERILDEEEARIAASHERYKAEEEALATQTGKRPVMTLFRAAAIAKVTEVRYIRHLLELTMAREE